MGVQSIVCPRGAARVPDVAGVVFIVGAGLGNVADYTWESHDGESLPGIYLFRALPTSAR